MRHEVVNRGKMSKQITELFFPYLGSPQAKTNCNLHTGLLEDQEKLLQVPHAQSIAQLECAPLILKMRYPASTLIYQPPNEPPLPT